MTMFKSNTNKKRISAVRNNILPKKTTSQKYVYRFLLVGFVVGVALLVNTWVSSLDLFPVKQVKIEGEFIYLDEETIKGKISKHSVGGFFDLDISELRNQLVSMDWIEDAFVRREWPDKIVIRVVEKKPVAKWNSSGVLTAAGHLFYPNEFVDKSNLVELNGPDGRHAFILSELNKIQSLYYPAGIHITKLSQNERRSWEMEIDGVEINLGRKNIYKKIENFSVIYTALFKQKISEIKQMDFRYTNGFSILWKQNAVSELADNKFMMSKSQNYMNKQFLIGAMKYV